MALKLQRAAACSHRRSAMVVRCSAEKPSIKHAVAAAAMAAVMMAPPAMARLPDAYYKSSNNRLENAQANIKSYQAALAARGAKIAVATSSPSITGPVEANGYDKSRSALLIAS